MYKQVDMSEVLARQRQSYSFDEEDQIPKIEVKISEGTVAHKYFPISAMVQDSRGRYLATTIGTAEEENSSKIRTSAKKMAQLINRDSKGNIEHMKATYNTIRVIGKG